MTIYTGVADANGDFKVPFSSNYTGGQKITVTAEKDGATKSIELFAPSDTLGGGAIQFSGSLADFPQNIGGVILTGLSGVIGNTAFFSTFAEEWCAKATSLEIKSGITSIGSSAFTGWSLSKSLILPEGLLTISQQAFQRWVSATNLSLPSTLTSLANEVFSGWSSCNEVICKAINPPAITSTTFLNIKSTCVFKVPVGSVDAYKAAPNWSAFAARIQAI